MSSESGEDFKFPWTGTIKAMRDVVANFFCRFCKSSTASGVSECCNRFLCSKCPEKFEVCNACHRGLKAREGTNVKAAYEICTELLALLISPFEADLQTPNKNLGSRSDDLSARQPMTGEIDDADEVMKYPETVSEPSGQRTRQDEKNASRDETLRDPGQLNLSGMSTGSSSSFSRFSRQSVSADGSDTGEEGETSGRASMKRRRESPTIGPGVFADWGSTDGTNLPKRWKQDAASTSKSGKLPERSGEDSVKVLSPNNEKMVIANSLLDLKKDPVLFKTPHDPSSEITYVQEVNKPATPPRSISLQSNSSAFLTPASESKRSGRVSTRKPLMDIGQSSSTRTLRRGSASGGRGRVDLNSTLDSFVQRGSEVPPATPKGTSSGMGRGRVRADSASLPCTPNVRAPSVVRERPSTGQRSAKKSEGTKRNKKGETGLHIACIKGDLESVRKFLLEGVKPNERDNAGWTPLHEACNHGHDAIVDLLLKSGADVNAVGDRNCTPILDAAANDRISCVRILLQHGADPTIRNADGDTPESCARTPEMAELLRSHAKSNACHSSQVPRAIAAVRPEKIVITTTGVERMQKSWLATVIKKLGWELEENIEERVTHVITSANENKVCQRTLKYMTAILTGKWIVTIDWLRACEGNGDWVSEKDFEVSGCTNKPDGSVPAKARSNRLSQVPGVFANCSFFISGSIPQNSDLRSELASLIRLGSGCLLAREPKVEDWDLDADTSSRRPRDIPTPSAAVPFHAASESPFSTCSHFIVQDPLPGHASYIMVNRRLCKVAASWIYDCIASLSLVS